MENFIESSQNHTIFQFVEMQVLKRSDCSCIILIILIILIALVLSDSTVLNCIHSDAAIMQSKQLARNT